LSVDEEQEKIEDVTLILLVEMVSVEQRDKFGTSPPDRPPLTRLSGLRMRWRRKESRSW
jgi:hypothetical protein